MLKNDEISKFSSFIFFRQFNDFLIVLKFLIQKRFRAMVSEIGPLLRFSEKSHFQDARERLGSFHL